MSILNRRTFLQSAALAAAAGSLEAAPTPLRLGVVTRVRKGEDPNVAVSRVKSLGFPTCQINVQGLKLSDAGPLKAALAKNNVEATAIMELGPGKMVWNFTEGPATIGLVPAETRRARIDALKLALDVAAEAGIPALQTHLGFIPEFPGDPLFAETVAAVKEVAVHAKAKGLWIHCETGQESPVTLLRLIETVGTGNLGVNLDTANLILYGKGNPVDAMDVIGKYVRGLHAKDGLFPTDPKNLGKEVPIGNGKVDFPAVIKRLRDLHYTGAITIEREIEGARQTQDILASKAYLEKLIAQG